MLDYIKMLGDLIKDTPKLVERETVAKDIFTSQHANNLSAVKPLISSPEILGAMMGGVSVTGGVNWALYCL